MHMTAFKDFMLNRNTLEASSPLEKDNKKLESAFTGRVIGIQRGKSVSFQYLLSIFTTYLSISASLLSKDLSKPHKKDQR